MDTGLQLVAYKLSECLTELDSKRGELAEVRKVEAQAKIEGYVGDGVTDRRYNSDAQALSYTQDALDLEADVRSLERWADFYTLLIQQGIVIDMSTLPPRE